MEVVTNHACHHRGVMDCGCAMVVVPKYACPVDACSVVAVVVAVDGGGLPSFRAVWHSLDAEAYASH